MTSSNSASLESAGASALNNSEVGKLTSEVIMNRPKDPISMDAPFISGGFDIQIKPISSRAARTISVKP